MVCRQRWASRLKRLVAEDQNGSVLGLSKSNENQMAPTYEPTSGSDVIGEQDDV
jgi:hypothetical protein